MFPKCFQLNSVCNINSDLLAVSDLDTAIQLSGGHGQVAELAHTQRGLVRRLQGCDEGALEDFKAAAKLGGRFDGK